MLKRLWTARNTFSSHAIHMMLWLSISAFALGAFLILTWRLHASTVLMEFDYAVIRTMGSLRRPGWNGPAVDITALGSGSVITMLVVAGVVVLGLLRDWTGMFHLILSSAGAGIWTSIFKSYFERARPSLIPRLVEVSGYSYPSGHALASASVYLTIAVLASRKFRSVRSRVILFGLGTGWMFLVAASRVYLGVHYPTDILSGMLLGSSWSLLLAAIFSRLYWSRQA